MDITSYLFGKTVNDLAHEVKPLAWLVGADGNHQALRIVVVLGDEFPGARIILRVPVVKVYLVSYQGGGLAREHPLHIPPSHLRDTD